MISVLVVEDDLIKFGKLHAALIAADVSQDGIVHAITAADAKQKLLNKTFDLLLLDVNIPLRLGESPRRGGGATLLDDLQRDPAIRLPRYVVGITAYEDVVAEFGERFTDQLWSLVLYSDNSDRWRSQVASKVHYINAAKASDNFSDGRTYGIDLAILCALEDIEYQAVKELECDWQPLRLPHDETRYITGSIVTARGPLSVIAAAAPRMGMSASAVLASKMIAQFRPKILAMVGICAGRFGKVDIGDVIIADPTWDWGSGKIDSKDDKPRFRPSPHQVEMDTDMREDLKEIFVDVRALAEIKSRARGKKPPTDLSVLFGPLASGASVIANEQVFESLLDQHRNLLGIEMEAYGVALACQGSAKPRPRGLVVKGVCDFADKDKNDDFQEYAASVSALVLYHCAQKMFND